MITYSMSQVETLTGINAHTLRAWERRYNFILPERTETNIRYYSDAQLKNLLNIGILVRNGYRVSSVDKMERAEIHELVNQILTTHSDANNDKINGLVLSMLEMDEHAFTKIYNSAVADLSLLKTFTELIYPFLNLVGGLWTTNKIVPAHEHFISNLIRQKIIAGIAGLPSPKEDAKRILLFLLEEESHELGLLLSSYIAKKAGWKVYYLGQNVPTKNIIEILPSINPDLMMTMIITPRLQDVNEVIEGLTKGNSIPLWLSGNPTLFENGLTTNKVSLITSPQDFEVQLKAHKTLAKEA